MASSTGKETPPSKKCRLAEIVQFKCEPGLQADGPPQWHCLPVIRIFRICQDRPAVELTKFVDMNVETGAVQVPPQSSQVLPKAKLWRDITRYEDKAANDL
ncbi:uncharacterized protein TRAVEDRAFT_130257 [Trametes versicolor FP-101664 SS1]|uniref:uncharacterized protein n=1 Tax=Trametes versicolor (strain FP-101664) TaxID=717944 RepID=UPI00046225B4|nr:uncharacterized protein TRAVEDRAFT_130257 [Trametes versicolor FP-101664 SS1]EIW55468.1 hypothetical protein TRAVEDRAFT_130257 [Trametes versicolor FP-101664 SS1]